ncbi:hypothetical protein [Streptacidiphilus sp. PAMC 29251]
MPIDGLSRASCRFNGLVCALCLREFADWERAHQIELEPYYATDTSGHRGLRFYDRKDPLYLAAPQTQPAVTIAPITADGSTLAIAVCYEHFSN